MSEEENELRKMKKNERENEWVKVRMGKKERVRWNTSTLSSSANQIVVWLVNKLEGFFKCIERIIINFMPKRDKRVSEWVSE